MEGDIPPQVMGATPIETRSVPSLPSSRLPVSPTPFVGRERQVAEACSLLKQDSVRLLTLVGPGGIGKTRLALSVVETLRGKFADGVCYVPLGSLTDAGLVLPAIAQALGLHESGNRAEQLPLPERLQDLLAERHMLLVLDNFEQVAGAASDLAALLAACSRLKVFVTSREVLRLSAEQSYPVPPLALPDLDNLTPVETLARIEAVRLFVMRAQAAQPGFALTPSNARPVASLCHRLDGLPLAIELAAARIRLLSPAEMLTRLDSRLSWLTGGPRDAPDRHQTLRAAIGWSYDLLTSDEQALFRQLAVFVGGCIIEAAASVCKLQEDREQPAERLLQALGVLVDKSLLRQEPGAADKGRLYMLETIREYALEQLAAGSETEQVRRAHADYYVALVEEAETMLMGAAQHEWHSRLEQEHDNLRAALVWSVSAANPEVGLRLAAALWRFWLTHGHLSEGQRWLNAALADASSLPKSLQAKALNGVGRLALRQGDYASAQSTLEVSLALWRSLADTRGEIQVLNSLGLVALYQDDLPRAQRYMERCLAGWQALGDRPGITHSLNNLGITLRYQGDFVEAARLYEASLALAREFRDEYPISAMLHNLGQMAHHQGDDTRAHSLLSDSLAISRQLGDRPGISVDLADLAGVWAARGKPHHAAILFGAAEALREKMGASMYPAQRAAYEQDVNRGASQLDPAPWEAAWAQGRALPLDDACALAVEQLPPVSAFAPGAYDLTERELEVLRLLVAGLTYAQIADRLTVSFHTVHAHLRSIYGKLGVTSRNQATRFAMGHGLT